jgi:ubiquinol-cytochrome c reductase cytochrome c1 subunit
MGRLIAFLAPFAIGSVFVLALLFGAFMPRDAVTPDATLQYHLEAKEVRWQNDGRFGMGVFGTFDRAQLQRGFKVYTEVCSACHSLNRIAFRNLSALGFSTAEIKAIAKKHDVPSIDEKTGEPATRPAIPSDHFSGPFANDIAARAANNNALPPDLSLITKAREHGPRYVYSILTGYKSAPADWKVPTGLHFNPYFKALNIAMPAPLTSDGQVEYTDGTKSTVDQNAKDVAAFLTWTAEPKLEDRRRTGVGAVIFLLILSALSYLSYRRVWADIKYKSKKGEVASA